MGEFDLQRRTDLVSRNPQSQALHKSIKNELHQKRISQHGFAQKSCGLNVPAPPPDVRQGSALPEAKVKKFGLCPRFGLWPQNIGQSPTGGRAQTNRLDLTGGAQPRLTSGGEAGASAVKGRYYYLVLCLDVQDGISHQAAKPGRKRQVTFVQSPQHQMNLSAKEKCSHRPCLKSQNHSWIASVQGAGATWSAISMRYLV